MLSPYPVPYRCTCKTAGWLRNPQQMTSRKDNSDYSEQDCHWHWQSHDYYSNDPSGKNSMRRFQFPSVGRIHICMRGRKDLKRLRQI